jgi:sulfur carrier protein ThiS
MVVTVYLHTGLQRQTADGPQRQMDVTLLSGSTLAHLLQDLGLDLAAGPIMSQVNGRIAESTKILEQGDQIDLMPVTPEG